MSLSVLASRHQWLSHINEHSSGTDSLQQNDAVEPAVSEKSKKLLGRLYLLCTLKTHACTLLIQSWDVEFNIFFLSERFFE